MSTSALIHASIEQAINQYLALDPAALKKLTPLHSKVIAVIEDEPDCVISGTPLALAKLGSTQQGASQLIGGDLSIRGDTELAHQFGKVLGAMEIDWQARLTPYTGSLLADDLVAIAGTLHGWG